MNTDTSSELRASPPRLQGRRRLPFVAEAPRLRRLRLILLIPTPINEWEGKVSALLQNLRCALTNRQYDIKNITQTNGEVTRTSQRAPEMVPIRPAAPEIDCASSCCGRGCAHP